VVGVGSKDVVAAAASLASATVVDPENVDADDFARLRLGIVIVVSRSLAQRNRPAETFSYVTFTFRIKIQDIKEEIYRTKMTCEQEVQTLDRWVRHGRLVRGEFSCVA
jgi:hypothetical protein